MATLTQKPTSKRRVSVTFASNVAVRTYQSILSDHPCCSAGPPVGLGWAYEEEQTRLAPGSDKAASNASSRMRALTFVLSPGERLDRCLNNGATQDEVREACAAVRRIQKWREESLANFEEPLESAKAFLEHFSASTRAALKGLGEPLAFQPLAQFGDLSELCLNPTKSTPSSDAPSNSPRHNSHPRSASPQPQKSNPLSRSPTRRAQEKSKQPLPSSPATDLFSSASSFSSSLPSWPSSKSTSSGASSSMSVGSLTSGLQSWLAPLGMGSTIVETKPRSPKWSLDGRVVRKPATSGS